MSLILDALKKLDRDKTAKRQGALNIASGILLQERSKRRLMLVPVAAVLFTAVAAVAVTYYWTGVPFLTPVTVQTAPTVPAPAVQAEPSLQPLPPVVKQEPAVEPKPGPSAEPGKQQTATPPPPAAEVKKPVEKSRTRTPAVTDTGRAQERNDNTAPSTRPALKVSGIVWQEDRPARRAFVNDIPVREGDMIKDVKVVEILPNNVRFSQDGKVFDVRLFE
jgi:general secretion pathway protein B